MYGFRNLGVEGSHLEGQWGLVSNTCKPHSNPLISIINLLTRSPQASKKGPRFQGSTGVGLRV